MPRWESFDKYFWRMVDKTDTCWEWTGNYSKGYGRVHYKNTRTGAHRVSWMMTFGDIKDGLFVCHKCDNRKCVRPEHLFLGTQKDNMQDWTRKGKNKALVEGRLTQYGDNHWLRKPGSEVARRLISQKRKYEFSSGLRRILRNKENGRIIGTAYVG